jgi:hypothetical protein
MKGLLSKPGRILRAGLLSKSSRILRAGLLSKPLACDEGIAEQILTHPACGLAEQTACWR